jgi:hypothetical protein
VAVVFASSKTLRWGRIRTEVPILHLEVVAARKEAAVRHSYQGMSIGHGIAPSGVNG